MGNIGNFWLITHICKFELQKAKIFADFFMSQKVGILPTVRPHDYKRDDEVVTNNAQFCDICDIFITFFMTSELYEPKDNTKGM